MAFGKRMASVAFIGALIAGGLVGCGSEDGSDCPSAEGSVSDMVPAAFVMKGGGSGGHSSSGGRSGSSGSSGRSKSSGSGSNTTRKSGTSGSSGRSGLSAAAATSNRLSLAKTYSAPMRPSALGGAAGSHVASGFSGYGPSSFGGGFNYYYLGHPYPWYYGPSFYSGGRQASCPSGAASVSGGAGGGF